MNKNFIPILLLVLLLGSSLAYAEKIQTEQLAEIAKQGNKEAQIKLGRIYLFGDTGEEINYKKAAYWSEIAANQGDANSQYNIAMMYFRGFGVKKDLEKAFKYYKKAADQGHHEAQIQLALRYLNGEGVTRNLKTAQSWYEQAKKSNNPDLKPYLHEYEKLVKNTRTQD